MTSEDTDSALKWRDVIVPSWPALPQVRAFSTTRAGGASTGDYASLNVGKSVGDDPACVDENRRRVTALMGGAPRWIELVHGTAVADLDAVTASTPVTADAAVTRQPGVVCVVTMADCLCVLFRNREGTIVGAAHAGWRGLVDGVLEATVRAMNVDPTSIQAWLSPAIGPDAFEVAEDVRARIISASQGSAAATQSATLAAIATSRARTDRWHVDLFALARIRLGQCGVLDHHIYGGGMCTYSDPARFFSHRRATHELRKTGRMAALIAIV